jgi:sulfopyruvate decarboxylase TPP-binding subunit
LIVDAINGREVMLLQSTGEGNYIEAVYGLKTYRIARGQLIDAVYGKIIATLTWVSP